MGAIFIDPKVLTDVALIITEPRMFYRRSHDCIYKAMLALRDAGREIDWVHVLEAVGVAGDFEACGGREFLTHYLREITSAVPSAYGADGYATIVRNNYARREIGFSGREIDKLALDPTKSPTEIIEILERKVVALDSIATSSSLRRAGEFGQRAITELAERKLLKDSGGTVITGMSSGFPDIDAYSCGWRGGQMIVFGARAKTGKTSMLLEIARRNMEVANPEPGVFFTLEMTERELHQKLACSVANLNPQDVLRGDISDEQAWEYEQACEKINAWPLYFERGRRGMTMRQIRSKSYQAAERFGVKWIMIDYLQFIKKRWFRTDTFEHISECSRACKTLAGELNVPVITAAQVKRLEKRRGKEPPPTMSDLRGSGDIEQDADGIYLLHTRALHGDNASEIDVIIDGNRHGPSGTVALRFDRKTGRFEPAPVGANDAAYKDYTEKEAPEPELDAHPKQAPGADVRPVVEKQILKPGAEDDPRKEAPPIPKAEAREMFKTPAQGGKAIRV